MSSRSPDLPAAFLTRPLAHRGLHDRAAGVIENSRAAVRAAIAAGYGIEIDIQRAADGEAMVFHDDEMPRLTGQPGLVRDYGARDLGRMVLTGSAGGETIPTLAEILAIVAGQAPLLVEIKDQDGALGPGVGALEARIAALVAGYDGPLAFMSFNPHSVAAIGEAAPDRPRGLTTCDFEDGEASLPDYRRAELEQLSDAERVGRGLRLARPPRPRQSGGGPAEARGAGDPLLDDPQPRGREGRPAGRRQHHLRGIPPGDRRMSRGLVAGAALGLVLLAAGTALGTLRALLVAPRIGEGPALAIELPLMLAIAWGAAGGSSGGSRWRMGRRGASWPPRRWRSSWLARRRSRRCSSAAHPRNGLPA